MRVPESLAAMPRFLEQALAAASADALALRGPAGTFSLTEQACHLRDLEREGYLVRLRRTLSENCPDLQPFDGTAIAAARDYGSQDPRAAARDFAGTRREVVALLQPLEARELRREATFGGRRISLADIVAMMVEHDREHREEIERLMDSLEE